MSGYQAPVEDMAFVIDELCAVGAAFADVPRFAGLGLGAELTATLLAESARFSGELLAPLRRVGDRQPATCADGRVAVPPGFEDAYRQFAAGGWAGISADPEFAGQGLPELYATAACEMWNGANMAFALAPILSIGAARAIRAHGDERQKATYLARLHTGEWAGTMNLTETAAGSDLGAIRARAVPERGRYRIRGQKIFITWGDHEAADNIVHLVLARLPDAPAGGKGLSLFIVPKFLVEEDGSLGARNDVYPVSTERKLGIHGSPTCVMAYGEREGALGDLLGGANDGLRCMFTMMNEARLKVGVQALGVADGAYQQALAHARQRVQGGAPIIRHPDVRRMLLTMRAASEAMRAFAYAEAVTLDLARHLPDAGRQARIDLLIPVIKGWLTEMGEELASLGVQIHGGMGYIEETGAAQYLRDVRIASIYEGTNGIQAADLVGRKLARDGGAAMDSLLAEAEADARRLAAAGQADLLAVAGGLARALAQLRDSTEAMLAQCRDSRETALAGAFDYMMQVGFVMGGWHMARSAELAAAGLDGGSQFRQRKLRTARYYVEQILPRAGSHGQAAGNAGGALRAFAGEQL